MNNYLWHRSIEPIDLSGFSNDPKNFVLSVSVLSWLVNQLYENEKIDDDELLIDVAFVGFLGKYPAIVIQFKKGDPSDEDLGMMEEQLLEMINDILKHKLLIDFIKFITKENKDWQKITNDLIAKYT
ncbi:MAG TPA: hypothetical protein DCY03_28800 [Planctomycetaceae bacterium]|nr:hypothetical protein [Planctomycetaceae bacterium]|tara:strand:- start:3153 stop:3533 length:381 start_codon:yes stop_codon:yes gene_type:complete